MAFVVLDSLRGDQTMSTATSRTGENETTILARVLGNEHGRLSPEMARHLLNLGFGDRDKARMHDLTVRNQDDALSPAVKDELLAFSKAGTLLSILNPGLGALLA